VEPTLQEKYGFDTILQLISGVVTVIVLGVPMVHKARLLLRRRRLRRARRFEETSQVNNDLTGTLLSGALRPSILRPSRGGEEDSCDSDSDDGVDVDGGDVRRLRSDFSAVQAQLRVVEEELRRNREQLLRTEERDRTNQAKISELLASMSSTSPSPAIAEGC